jgi:hypothetical protein
MRSTILALLVDFLIVAVVANPVSQDLFLPYDYGFEVPGDPFDTAIVFDPFYEDGATMEMNGDWSPLTPSDPNELLYTEMMIPWETEVSLNQEELLPENDVFLAQFDQPYILEADGDCDFDLIEAVGKTRLRRWCPQLKKDDKPEKEICRRDRSQLACCKGEGIAGVHKFNCEAYDLSQKTCHPIQIFCCIPPIILGVAIECYHLNEG